MNYVGCNPESVGADLDRARERIAELEAELSDVGLIAAYAIHLMGGVFYVTKSDLEQFRSSIIERNSSSA